MDGHSGIAPGLTGAPRDFSQDKQANEWCVCVYVILLKSFSFTRFGWYITFQVFIFMGLYMRSNLHYIYEVGHEKRYQVLVSSYGDNRQNVKVIGKTEIGLWKIISFLLINLCM